VTDYLAARLMTSAANEGGPGPPRASVREGAPDSPMRVPVAYCTHSGVCEQLAYALAGESRASSSRAGEAGEVVRQERRGEVPYVLDAFHLPYVLDANLRISLVNLISRAFEKTSTVSFLSFLYLHFSFSRC